jgi:cysteine-rich repeat protein
MRIAMSLAALTALVLATPVRAQVCGNGVREGAEQCDDGNTANLDGCSATCTFEQVQRVNQLKMQFATNTVCTVNKLGSAFTSVAQPQLQSAIDASVADGSTSALLYFLDLSDLSGYSAPSVTMGLLNGAPLSTAGYDGTSDVDWWYLTDPSQIDANRLPLNLMSGNIAAQVLHGAPGAFALNTNLGGVPTTLRLSSLMINANIGTSSAPLNYDGSASRGHLPDEHLDPALTSFETAGNPASPSGSLCGDVSTVSLANTPLPATFIAGGSTACDQGYSIANSTLDMLVGGCTFLGFIQVVNPAQPDRSDPAAPPAGAGAPYNLSASANHVVDTCRDKNNASVPLATCLTAAAYSAFYKFSSDRVILRYEFNDLIFRDGFQ